MSFPHCFWPRASLFVGLLLVAGCGGAATKALPPPQYEPAPLPEWQAEEPSPSAFDEALLEGEAVPDPAAAATAAPEAEGAPVPGAGDAAGAEAPTGPAGPSVPSLSEEKPGDENVQSVVPAREAKPPGAAPNY